MDRRSFLEETYLNLCAQLCWAIDFQAVSKYDDDFLLQRIIDGFTQIQKRVKEAKDKESSNTRANISKGKND